MHGATVKKKVTHLRGTWKTKHCRRLLTRTCSLL